MEHPFRVVKRQLGYVKTRYRGLAKNAAQVVTLFALANLYQARRLLTGAAGEKSGPRPPETGNAGKK